jgi:FtsZ-binding cell division protein ZapB
MDETIAETPLKDLAQVELVIARMPIKALYKLQFSVAQQVKSRTIIDAAELQHTKNGKEALELVVEKVKIESKEEKENTNIMEQGLTTMYNHIPNNTQEENRSTEENLNLIEKTIHLYRQEIEELKETLNPMTPPEVKEQRKQKAALQMAAMEEQVSAET